MDDNQDLDVDRLLPLYIGHDSQPAILSPQLEHRLNLIKNIWKISPGSTILEIGCGQGDCTLILAAAVGSTGRIDAVDPCPLDYGSPWTVGQSQSFLKSGRLGYRMNFFQSDPMDFLRKNSTVYDYIVLNNCLWYFSSAARISSLLSLLVPRTHARKVLIAEWSLTAPSPAQVPHLLAALTRANREYCNPASTQNIRTAVSPGWFKRWFSEHGIEIEECIVEVPEGMLDGRWEVGSVVSEEFMKGTRKIVGDEGQLVALEGMRDAVISAVERLKDGVEAVRCMPIWAASF